jgi:uncharacterized RDD family membrane protein YckC
MQESEVPRALETHVFAGFWRRAAAYAVDSVLLGLAMAAVVGALLPVEVLQRLVRAEPSAPSADWEWFFWISLLGAWLYFALLESSAWQATPGKRLLGLKVTDLEGQPITFARASARYFGRILSGLPLGAGYLLAAFTARRQALHDLLAGCLVLRRAA